jgi:hypothetical protein
MKDSPKGTAAPCLCAGLSVGCAYIAEKKITNWEWRISAQSSRTQRTEGGGTADIGRPPTPGSPIGVCIGVFIGSVSELLGINFLSQSHRGCISQSHRGCYRSPIGAVYRVCIGVCSRVDVSWQVKKPYHPETELQLQLQPPTPNCNCNCNCHIGFNQKEQRMRSSGWRMDHVAGCGSDYHKQLAR